MHRSARMPDACKAPLWMRTPRSASLPCVARFLVARRPPFGGSTAVTSHSSVGVLSARCGIQHMQRGQPHSAHKYKCRACRIARTRLKLAPILVGHQHAGSAEPCDSPQGVERPTSFSNRTTVGGGSQGRAFAIEARCRHVCAGSASPLPRNPAFGLGVLHLSDGVKLRFLAFAAHM